MSISPFGLYVHSAGCYATGHDEGDFLVSNQSFSLLPGSVSVRSNRRRRPLALCTSTKGNGTILNITVIAVLWLPPVSRRQDLILHSLWSSVQRRSVDWAIYGKWGLLGGQTE